MAVTLEELFARVAAKFDPNDLVELLNLSSEDIVRAFNDLIEERQDDLRKELEDDGDFAPQGYQETED